MHLMNLMVIGEWLIKVHHTHMCQDQKVRSISSIHLSHPPTIPYHILLWHNTGTDIIHPAYLATHTPLIKKMAPSFKCDCGWENTTGSGRASTAHLRVCKHWQKRVESTLAKRRIEDANLDAEELSLLEPLQKTPRLSVCRILLLPCSLQLSPYS